MSGSSPPFRADHVGSLLRPPELSAARERWRKGEIDRAALRQAEDAAIRQVVELQESAGLKGVTDGELRRASFHTDFLSQLAGLEWRPGESPTQFRNVTTGEVTALAPPKLLVTGKVRRTHAIM